MLTILKLAVKWHLVCSHGCATTSYVISNHFHHSKRKLHTLFQIWFDKDQFIIKMKAESLSLLPNVTLACLSFRITWWEWNANPWVLLQEVLIHRGWGPGIYSCPVQRECDAVWVFVYHLLASTLPLCPFSLSQFHPCTTYSCLLHLSDE